ncbi:hypothetical protein [Nocardia terrae]|nr:hypothetical protein [Nocardia terrae]
MNLDHPVSTGRHERDRNMVSAIRARIKSEDRAAAATPKSDR